MTIELFQARNTLAELLKRPIPAAAAEARRADIAAVNNGDLTENDLVAFYNTAYGTLPIDEEEFILPELQQDAPWEFYNANTCLPIEHEEETLTLLLADPYDVEHLTYLVEKTWQKKLLFRFARRPFLERLLNKLQSLDEDRKSVV